jgi:hypothetical protein
MPLSNIPCQPQHAACGMMPTSMQRCITARRMLCRQPQRTSLFAQGWGSCTQPPAVSVYPLWAAGRTPHMEGDQKSS